jgi:hypothetical protein
VVHKRYFNCFKRIEIIENIFSDYNGLKIATTNRKTAKISPNIWKLTLLNDSRFKEVSREI